MGGIFSSDKGSKSGGSPSPASATGASGRPGSEDKGADRREAEREALRLLPVRLEQGWQEAARLAECLREWGGGSAGVPEQRLAAANDLGMAHKNILRLLEAEDTGDRSPLRDATAPDRKQAKRMMKKLRTAVKAAPALRLPRMPSPKGSEPRSWKGKWVDERATGLMLALDNLELNGDELLRKQRKALVRALEGLSRAAGTWAEEAREDEVKEEERRRRQKKQMAAIPVAAGFESSDDELSAAEHPSEEEKDSSEGGEGEHKEQDDEAPPVEAEPSEAAAEPSEAAAEPPAPVVDPSEEAAEPSEEVTQRSDAEDDDAEDDDGWVVAGREKGRKGRKAKHHA